MANKVCYNTIYDASVRTANCGPNKDDGWGFSCQQCFFQQFWEKAPGQNWEKMIDLTAKLGEINDIEHNKGSKIYPQNPVILDCIMPTIPFKHTS